MRSRYRGRDSRLPRGPGSRLLAAAVVLLTAAATALSVASCATASQPSHASSKERSVTSQRSAPAATGIGAALARVRATKVFFGHQSVGMNILGGVPGVYAAYGMTSPLIEQDATAPGKDGGFIDHRFIGENEDPALKIEDFAARLRSGLGQRVDVAMMKFCYVDVTSGTDVSALFASYRTTMAALQQEFPKVTFVYLTVPLTTEPGLLSRVKSKLTGGGAAADNAARERLNALIRHQYAASGHLLDLAAIESTAPDGTRIAGTYRGQRYYALDERYAADSGHLNATGARIVATAWLQAIAQASPK